MAERILITCTDSMMKQFLEPHVLNLIDHGFEVEVACSEVLGRFREVQEDLGDLVKIHKVNLQRSPLSPSNLQGYCEVKQIVDSGRFDLIWTNEPVMGVATRLAARKARKKGTRIFYMAHGFHFYKGAPLKNWLIFYPIEKWMARYTDKLITINQEDFQFAQTHFPCPVFHIHGTGANSKKFHPVSREEQLALRKELGLDGRLILNVGELNPNKNQKTAILVLKEVLKSYPDAKLLIAGKGEEKENLTRLVQTEGLEDKVIFLGYTLELERYMQICDVEIACSYREGMPLNVIEAMLCGKPVVASHNRGHDELIRDGINGFLVDTDDVPAYGQAICHILDSRHDDRDALEKNVAQYIDLSVKDEILTVFLEQ